MMKPNLIKFLPLAILLLVFGFTARSQDYVITMNGDSLSCAIKTTFLFPEGLSFAVGEGKSVKLKPNEVKQYYLSEKNTTYRSVTMDGMKKPEFMPVITQGKINLYKKFVIAPPKNRSTSMNIPAPPPRPEMIDADFHWYASKSDDIVIEVKNPKLGLKTLFKPASGGLAKMLSDNKEVYDRYMTEEYSIENVQELITLYNKGKL
jgi:hypothetical protein